MKRLLSIGTLFGFVALVHGQGTNLIIATQPQSQTVPLGSTVTFSVTASGPGPLTYQWQFDGTNLPDSIITTLAGDGTGGYSGDGGPATNASFNVPNGLAVDGFGNLFIGDTYNFRVRMVSPGGVITTVAGNGVSGYSGDGGPATNAAVNHPIAVAVDALGNLFIAQSWGQRIRKVSTNGIITTVAGNGAEGFSGDGAPPPMPASIRPPELHWMVPATSSSRIITTTASAKWTPTGLSRRWPAAGRRVKGPGGDIPATAVPLQAPA